MNSYTNYANAYPAGPSSRKRERANNAERQYGTVPSSAAVYAQSPYGYYPPVNGYYNYGYMPQAPVAPPARSTSYDYPAAPYPPQVQRNRRTSDPGTKPQGRPVYSDARRAKTSREKGEEDEFTHVRRGRMVIGNVGSQAQAQVQAGVSNILQSIPSIPSNTPNFLFVSLDSHDVLKISNLSSLGDAEEFIRASLKRAWSGQYTEEHTEERGLVWSLTLGGDVWSATGTFGIKARRYIRKLFRIFAKEGIRYLTSTGSNPFKTPRMVFTTGHAPDPDPDYFMISFSSNQHTLQIIDAPQTLAETIGLAVGINQKPLPPRPGEVGRDRTTRTNEWITREIYQVPTNPEFNKDIGVMMAVPLRLMAAEGWQLEASVPLGRCGILGHKGRREVWMLRRTLTPEEERYAGFQPVFADEYF